MADAQQEENTTDGTKVAEELDERTNSYKEALQVRANFNRPAGWIIALGALLAWCAGVVDVVAKHELGQYVSHVTGTTAAIGMKAEGAQNMRNEPHELWEMVGLFLSFLFGAILCGIVVAKNEVTFGKSYYGVALFGNSLFLFTAYALTTWIVPPNRRYWSLYFCAAACGLQNGMCTMHYGAVIRTTHATGLTTDCGLTLGRMLSKINFRGRRINRVDKAELYVDSQKLLVFSSIFTGFVLGAFCGSWLTQYMRLSALLVPAGVTFTIGVGYTIVYIAGFMTNRRKELELDVVDHDLCDAESRMEHAHEELAAFQREEGGEGDVELARIDSDVQEALQKIHSIEVGMQRYQTAHGAMIAGAGAPRAG